MMKKQRLAVVGSGVAVLGMMVLFQNCGGMNSLYQDEASNVTSAASVGSSSLGKFSVSSVNAQASNLGQSLSIPFVISADSTFKGNVALAVRQSDLNAVDTAQSIKFAFDKPVVTLAPMGSQTVKLTVTIPTLAPSFSNLSVHVDAVDATGTVKSSVVVPLTVNAVYDVNIHAGTSATLENWGLAVGSVTQFISHAEGLSVRFNNYDVQNNIVHSTGGPIAHESQTDNYPGTTSTGMPMSPDAGTTSGGQYVQVVAAGTAMETSQVYSHNHEAGSQGRTLQFNVPVAVAPAPTATPSASASTLTQVRADIITSKCVGCHQGTSPAGGVQLSTYAGISAVVKAGNHSASAIYLATSGSNPQMPIGGTALTATQLAELASWIDAGALNN